MTPANYLYRGNIYAPATAIKTVSVPLFYTHHHHSISIYFKAISYRVS